MKTLLANARLLAVAVVVAACFSGRSPSILAKDMVYKSPAVGIASSWRESTWTQPKLDLDGYLRAVALVESSNNPNAIGDGGRALGLYQFHRGTWDFVSRLREQQGKDRKPFSYAMEPRWASAYCMELTLHNRLLFQCKMDRSPTYAELYAMHNLGWCGFARRNYSVSECPKTTKAACSRVTRFMNAWDNRTT